MTILNYKVDRKIGAAILLCSMAALIYLFWPVSESRWSKAAVVLENRFAYALSVDGDTLYFTGADTGNGLYGESFRRDLCERSQVAVGYFSWPWGRISAQPELMSRVYSDEWLKLNTADLLENTLNRVAVRQQTMEHQLKELAYYDETHMKDDDGWLEMKHMKEMRLQEQRHLDSVKVVLEHALQNPAKLSWNYLYKVTAFTTNAPEGNPCGSVSIGKSAVGTSLTGSMPEGSGSVMSWNFGADRMLLDTAIEDTLQQRLGIVPLEEGTYKGMLAGNRPQGWGVMHYADGRRYSGYWQEGKKQGNGEMALPDGVYLSGEWEENFLMNGRVDYLDGSRYEGSLLNDSIRDGAGDLYYADGSVYWGTWGKGIREGFGMYVASEGLALAGTWEEDKYQGERLLYTEDRVYGIDIARYQHMNRRRRPANIAWKYLRITSLGNYSRKRIKEEKVDYPISFVYVKCTEGVTVLNQYYKADDQQIRNLGLHTGAYHFFQGTPAKEQLDWFLKHVHYEKGDLPPVLDIEPTNAQIKQKWGSDEKMFSEALIWLKGVEKALGVKPLLYVNQGFINNHLSKADEELQTYDLWVARYGEFKPYARMVCWQLSPDGKVSGIQSDVDINVFNGSKDKFNEYIQSLQ